MGDDLKVRWTSRTHYKNTSGVVNSRPIVFNLTSSNPRVFFWFPIAREILFVVARVNMKYLSQLFLFPGYGPHFSELFRSLVLFFLIIRDHHEF